MPTPLDREKFYREAGLWTDQSLGLLPAMAAGRWPDREFVSVEGERFTYAEFWRWTIATAHDLAQRGLRPGDRILLQIANGMEVLVLQFAAWRIGAVCVPVVPLYRLHELRTIADELRPRMIAASSTVGNRELAGEIEALVDECDLHLCARYLVGGADRPGWVRIPGFGDAPSPPVEVGLPDSTPADECCLILYTSGSTSAPKGARLTPRAILANSIGYRLKQGLGETMVTLAASPLAHVAALATGIINPMTVGGRTVVMTSWRPDAAIDLIEREKITHFGTVVTFLQDIVERYEAGVGGTHRLHLVSVGGATTPPSLIERADAIGIKAINQFGMTEVACNATLGHRDDPLHLRATCTGKVMYGTEIEAVDPQRRPLPLGEIGELRIRSPQMMLGYTDERVTGEQLDEDGWFYSGDLGSVDAQGWLRVSGRIKDIINRGGEKFSAQDIEMALMDAPGIAVAAVVGAPHPRFGEVVAAFLKLRAGGEWAGPEAMVDHLEAIHMARSKFPVIWNVVDDFPRTATGKIHKPGLLALLAAEQGSS